MTFPSSARHDDGARSPSVATFLSFVWPGLGQWYVGHRLIAIVFAVPVLVAVFLLGVEFRNGMNGFAAALLDPAVSLGIIAGALLLGVWRLIAMVQAAASARSSGERRRGRGALKLVLPLLGVLVIASHALVAVYAYSFYDFSRRAFVSDTPGAPAPAATTAAAGSAQATDTDSPDDSGAIVTAEPTPSALPGTTASPTPTAAQTASPTAVVPLGQQRISILLMGIDTGIAGPNRDHALTDTLLVVSIDPVTRDVAMVSVPRDVSNLPLDTSEFPFWRGHLYGNRINSLMSYSARHPSQFGNMPPPEVIAHEVGYLIGIKVPYYATVDLAGFEKVVDLVGGVDIDNPRDLDDPTYPGGPNGAPMHFHLSAGPHHLDGATALKYARVRHSKCESDFSRAARQQQILTALRHQVQSPDVLPRVPALLNEAADLIRTNFPVARVGALVQLGAQVDEANVHKYVLAPTYSAQLPGSAKLGLNMARVATLSVALFGDDSRYHTTTPKGPLPEPARVTSCAGG